MTHCDNANDTRLVPEYERVRETSQRDAPMNFVELFAEGRQFDQHGNNTLDL